MSSNSPFEVIDGLIRAVVIMGKLAIVFVGLFFQPFYILEHYRNEKARIARMRLFAKRLGLEFTEGVHRGMKRELRFLRKVDGTRHYALNIMRGEFDGHSITMFDYHRAWINWDVEVWEYSRWIKRKYCSFFVLDLEKEFPALTVVEEREGLGVLKRIGDAVGLGDIDFESHEFSEKFDVRGDCRKFAYDFCNARMMEHLLSQPILPIEVEHKVLAISFECSLEDQDIQSSVGRLLAIRERMPDYLFA